MALPRSLLLVLLSLIGTLACGNTLVTPVQQPCPMPPNPSPDIAKALLNEINTARVIRGINTVVLDDGLNCAASRHANDVGPRRMCSHTGSDGSTPWQRAASCGATAHGEIVACGQISARAAVDAWTLSPGHAAIMFDPGQKAMGAAMLRNHWVVLFKK